MTIEWRMRRVTVIISPTSTNFEDDDYGFYAVNWPSCRWHSSPCKIKFTEFVILTELSTNFSSLFDAQLLAADSVPRVTVDLDGCESKGESNEPRFTVAADWRSINRFESDFYGFPANADAVSVLWNELCRLLFRLERPLYGFLTSVVDARWSKLKKRRIVSSYS